MKYSIGSFPELSSGLALFGYLGVNSSEAKFLYLHSKYRYSISKIPKKRGGYRELRVPDDRLKYLQRRLVPVLEKLYTIRAPVHGFALGRSSVTNAACHQARPYLLNIDLENFFGSITSRRVKGLFEALHIPPSTIEVLVPLVTVSNQLPQGAPTSPIISNMVCFRLDRQFMQFAKIHHLRYTRYADDLTLSGFKAPIECFEDGLPISGRIDPSKLSVKVRSIIYGNDFGINKSKVWFSEKGARKEVTGLIVNQFVNVPRKYIRNLRASIYKLESMGIAAAQADFEARYSSTSQLADVLSGRLNWLAQVRGYSFEPYRKLASKYNLLFPTRKLRIDPSLSDIINRAVWAFEWIADTPDEKAKCNQASAVFVKGVGLVTAYHAVDGLPVGEAIDLFSPFLPGKAFSAKRTAIECPTRDIAILEHDVPKTEFHELLPASVDDPISSKTVAVGYPNFHAGDLLTKKEGEITSRFDRHSIPHCEVSQVLNSGMSGGPILNSRSEVIGIVHSGGLTEDRQIAVSIRAAVSLLEEFTPPKPAAV